MSTFYNSPHLSCEEIWNSATFFRFLPICQLEKSEISPHDRFFSTCLTCKLCDKYEVWLAPFSLLAPIFLLAPPHWTFWSKVRFHQTSALKSNHIVCFLTWKFASFCRSFPNAIRSPSLWWRSAYKFGDAAIRTDFCTHPDGVSYRPTYTHTFPWTPAKIIRAEVHSRCHSRYCGSLPSNTLISLFLSLLVEVANCTLWETAEFGKTSPSLFSVLSFIHF